LKLNCEFEIHIHHSYYTAGDTHGLEPLGYWGSWSTCQSSLSLMLSPSTCQIDSVLFYLARI